MKMFRVVVNGSEYRVAIEELTEESSSNPPVPPVAVTPPQPTRPMTSPPQPAVQPTAVALTAEEGAGSVRAPLPGTILRIAVNAGDHVSQGQSLLVLEAMKMENEIVAPFDGLIRDVKVSQGVSVNAGDTLVVLAS
jgi:glutaconyl-CoA/methylmalonyl-CoA decarboxylase subunit gamma